MGLLQKTSHRIQEKLFYHSNNVPAINPGRGKLSGQCIIIFANTKHLCENIWDHPAADGYRVGLLTGDISQKRHLRILEEFTHGALNILVATDVTGSELHIPSVTHVFNYDLPDYCEDYVHHIGPVPARAVVPSAWRVKNMH